MNSDGPFLPQGCVCECEVGGDGWRRSVHRRFLRTDDKELRLLVWMKNCLAQRLRGCIIQTFIYFFICVFAGTVG